MALLLAVITQFVNRLLGYVIVKLKLVRPSVEIMRTGTLLVCPT